VVKQVAVKWKETGVELLNPDPLQLDIIEANNPNDIEKCCKQMFDKWLTSKCDANWDQLIKALKSPSVDLPIVANHIAHMLKKEGENIDFL